jgi:hypothetical protein
MKGRLIRQLIVVAACLSILTPSAARAAQTEQGRGNRRGAPPAGNGANVPSGVSPAELQRLFDAYVVMQAQQELQLTDEQYPQFLSRVKALQEARRRSAGERLRVLAQLRRLTQPQDGTDDAQIRTQLKALDDLDARAAVDIRQALDALNQVLDVRQQARFRLFEEQMERRKVELLMRARQGRVPRNAPVQP